MWETQINMMLTTFLVKSLIRSSYEESLASESTSNNPTSSGLETSYDNESDHASSSNEGLQTYKTEHGCTWMWIFVAASMLIHTTTVSTRTAWNSTLPTRGQQQYSELGTHRRRPASGRHGTPSHHGAGQGPSGPAIVAHVTIGMAEHGHVEASVLPAFVALAIGCNSHLSGIHTGVDKNLDIYHDVDGNNSKKLNLAKFMVIVHDHVILRIMTSTQTIYRSNSRIHHDF